MKVGDLVRANSWLENIGGKIGIVTFVQDVKYCISARVLFDTGIVFMRIDNLRLANDGA